MSTSTPLTVPQLRATKRPEQPIVMITAYDFPTAQIVVDAQVDLILVGDSAAMVVLGYDSTTCIGMDEMLVLSAAVRRGAGSTLVVGDMPFGSYQASDELAITNATRFVAEGRVDMVKLEGGGLIIDRVAAITGAGIPVVGHLGLTPQTAVALGGYRAQARDQAAADQLVADAVRLEQSGASAIVLEAIPEAVAQLVTERITIPTIGIGAGVVTDGQVLVYHDLVGLSRGRAPRFVERYADANAVLTEAVSHWADDVRAHRYPAARHTYAMREGETARTSPAK